MAPEMAEHFYSRGRWVHATNGGVEWLFRVWIALGERLAAGPEEEAALAYLCDCHEHGGNGGRAFGLDPPPEALKAPERLRFLARLVAETAREVTREEHGLLSGLFDEIAWDRALRLRWLAKLADLYDFIGDAFPPGAAGLEPLVPDLPPQDQVRCRINRLLDRKGDMDRSVGSSNSPAPQERLALAEEILALLAQEEPDRWVGSLISALQVERSGLLGASGERERQKSALREALAAEPDEETRELIHEMVQALDR
jgi:hypothetical protein